jgi:RNA polymerase sigma-70 factor (ECF subfamily)
LSNGKLLLPAQHLYVVYCIYIKGVTAIRREDYERIVRGNAQKLYKTALAVTGNPSEAEEAVQDCFTRLWERKPSFASAAHETAWLIRVTVNFSKNRLTSAWTRRTVPLTECIPYYDGEERGLLEIVAKLPPKDRAAIHLFYYEGYSTKEIAFMTKQLEATVRSRLSRARAKLKGLLEDEPI